MSFQVLTDEQVESLDEEARKIYEERRALHEERLKYVQQIEKYDGIELPEVKPELNPVFMPEASEVPNISIEKRGITLPDTKVAEFSQELPNIPADVVRMTDVPEVAKVNLDTAKITSGKMSELVEGAVQISDFPNVDAKPLIVDKPEFSITHSEVPDIVIPEAAEYSYDLPEAGRVSVPEITFAIEADVPQIEMNVSMKNEVPVARVNSHDTRKIDMSRLEKPPVEKLEVYVDVPAAKELPKMNVDGKNISVPQNTISTVSKELPRISVDDKNVKVPENVIRTLSKELPKMPDESIQITEIPAVGVKPVNLGERVFDITESDVPEINLPDVPEVQVSTTFKYSYVKPELEELSLVEVSAVSSSIPQIDMKVQSQGELPHVNVPSVKLPEIDITKIGNNEKAGDDDVNFAAKAFPLPEIAAGFTREIKISVNDNIAIPEISQLPTAVSDERIAEVKSLINA